jgi:hypothetical protein
MTTRGIDSAVAQCRNKEFHGKLATVRKLFSGSFLKGLVSVVSGKI